MNNKDNSGAKKIAKLISINQPTASNHNPLNNPQKGPRKKPVPAKDESPATAHCPDHAGVWSEHHQFDQAHKKGALPLRQTCHPIWSPNAPIQASNNRQSQSFGL